MNWTMILLGCAGGALPDIIRIVKGRYSTELPDYLKSLNFWIGFALLIILGGLAALLGDAKGAKEALAFGFAAPEIISRALSGEPGTRGSTVGDITRFWAF